MPPMPASTHVDVRTPADVPPSSDRLAARLQHKYPDRVTGAITVPARAGRYAPFPDDLPQALAAALRARGLHQLYSHQAEAWEATQRGEDVVVVTPTASGRSSGKGAYEPVRPGM